MNNDDAIKQAAGDLEAAQRTFDLVEQKYFEGKVSGDQLREASEARQRAYRALGAAQMAVRQ